LKEYKYEEKGGAIKALQTGGVTIGIGSILVMIGAMYIISRNPTEPKKEAASK
tara:strand:+ start:360 stop:518 length:159 start_codon:yes stop_codon:yes gene_type:complete